MKTLTALTALTAAGLVAGSALAQAPAPVVFTSTDTLVYLDYNPPGGKTPAVKMACTKGVGRVDVATYNAKPVDQGVNLVSGTEKGSYNGKKATGKNGDYLKTQVFGSEKIMGAFRSSGNLEISGDGFKETIVAGANKDAVEKFFAGCEEG